jgi:GNAT superfamily N-acetyltransferase
MEIIIKEANTPSELRTFIRFANKLYKGNPYWVPSLYMDEINILRRDKNAAFKFCEAKYFMAYRGGRMVGRVAAIINNRHIEKWGQKYMRFGWFDFVDDPAVSTALMDSVENLAKEKGMRALHGPLGFTDIDREGMLVEGFDELSTLASLYNYSYYPQHMDKMGFRKDIDWMEYEIDVPEQADEKIARGAELVMKRNNLHLLNPCTKRELLPYAHQIFDILDEAYRHLYGVTPLSKDQVQAYIDGYFGLANPDFIPVVLDENNRAVAFGITFPSLSRALQKGGGELFPFGFISIFHDLKVNDRADLYLVGVREEYKGKGLNAILMDNMIKTFIKYGIKKVESNPELETNQNVQVQWKYFNKRQHKRRRCYIKELV